MTALTVWRFDTTDGAERSTAVLLDLADRDGDLTFDAAAVVWDPGKAAPRIRQVAPPSARPDRLGSGYWQLLFGLLFSLPLLGAALGAATGSGTGAPADRGGGDTFVNRIRDQLTPGSSAIFVLASDDLAQRLQDALTDEAPSVLARVPVSAELETALREVFGA